MVEVSFVSANCSLFISAGGRLCLAETREDAYEILGITDELGGTQKDRELVEEVPVEHATMAVLQFLTTGAGGW
jgi:hypothetical protein